ncbi:MAG: hypothetical protein Q9214_000415 [Letrouitia sp. 1 TL-2023]
MSLVLLSHACSHLQNASMARLGLTSIPSTNQLHTLMLCLQRQGFISAVAIGGPDPPPPDSLYPTLHPFSSSSESFSSSKNSNTTPAITQSNVASRRLWVGLKYWNNEPVLKKMGMVSKPTRRIWMGYKDLDALSKGQRSGYVKGLRALGESMFVTTDRGIMELRECIEKKTGGMILCRVNGL